ncbi:MAG: hypothetical protein NT068_00360 [Candidatus Nomurabacteria bacterium]|nr:hypothetical protein [Candidatus Nomurabacteria bacterium]
MKKLFPKIIISVVMIAIFLAPIVPSFQTKNKIVSVKIEHKVALASDCNPDTEHEDSSGNCVPNEGDSEIDKSAGFECNLWPSTWFRGCIVGLIYYMVFKPISYLATLAAGVLDFFIYYSTNSSSYSAGFVSTGWATVRDIANIFFIVALLYVAIQTILGLGSQGKKMISTIIIVALLINFSLFFTQVVIDGSNILAKVFYNQIKPVGANGQPVNASDQKSITVGLVSSFNPQDLMTQSQDDPGRQFVILILLIIMSVVMIYIFISIALLFVARVAGLWVAMIFSPIAFASLTLPFKIPGVGWDEWKNDLLKQAFLAPVVVFFFYIILLFGQNLHLINEDAIHATDNISALMKVIIPFFIMMMLLVQAKKLAVDWSGKIGAAINEAGGKVVGFATGAVTGGAAMMLQKTVGARATRTANDDELKAKAAGGDKDAQKRLEIANRRANRSYDFRQTGVGGFAAKQAGLDVNSGTSALGLDTKSTKGGYKAKEKKAIEKEEKRFKTYELSGEAAAIQNKKAEDAKDDNLRLKEYQEDLKTAKGEHEKLGLGTEFEEEEFKKAYVKGGDLSIHGVDKKVKGGSIAEEMVPDANDINSARRKAYTLSMINGDELDKTKSAMGVFFKEWQNGMKKMVTTANGGAATAALGIGSLGVLVAPTIVGGGLLLGLKRIFEDKYTGGIKRSDAELVNALRKSKAPDDTATILAEIKKLKKEE